MWGCKFEFVDGPTLCLGEVPLFAAARILRTLSMYRIDEVSIELVVGGGDCQCPQVSSSASLRREFAGDDWADLTASRVCVILLRLGMSRRPDAPGGRLGDETIRIDAGVPSVDGSVHRARKALKYRREVMCDIQSSGSPRIWR